MKDPGDAPDPGKAPGEQDGPDRTQPTRTTDPETSMSDVRDRMTATGSQIARHLKELVRFAAPVLADRALNAAVTGIQKVLSRKRNGKADRGSAGKVDG